MVYAVECPSCTHVIAKVADGVNVRAVPDRCPNCQAEVPQDWNKLKRIPIGGVDPRRQHPGLGGTGRQSHPI